MRLFFSLVVSCCLVLAACNTIDVYEKTTPFPAFKWTTDNKPVFNFTIKDTNALYNIFVVVKHEDAYHYNNLWLNVTTKAPGTAAVSQQLEIILANNGKGWLGSGIDDIFTHWVRITQAPVKLKKGDYQFTLQQIMRENPLESVLSAGIRVEKATP
ncbi:gliding motility lipoprotein GldH [Parasediminibacterium sp. JCM 36343]|uniref:gliding motility lipoprotein GldH n=1 Tax=Parasediminibacterium sp. JCM 36343 TaxID=3374279 RepID=UPI00397CE180